MTRRTQARAAVTAQRRYQAGGAAGGAAPARAAPGGGTHHFDGSTHFQSCTSAATTSPPPLSDTTASMFYPQPMEIAFSLEAGSFSSDLFETATTTASTGARSLAPLPNAYVICFEDVLVPIKWMAQHLNLRPSSKSINEAKGHVIRNPYLPESFARMEQAALQLLTNISARGPVCILSDQSARFVEAICQAFFPRLAYCLASPQVLTNVQVIGAPRKFETSQEKTSWRVHLMQTLVKDQLFAGNQHLLMDRFAGRFGLVVASPHQMDTLACAKAMEVAPFLVPKSIRVAGARNLVTLDQFIQHLQTLGQWLAESSPCTTPFSMNL